MTVEVKVCPRCGQQYKYTEKRVIKSQTYYYAIHITKDDTGKKHVHKCYLGAETYIYVKRVHMDSSIQFHGYVYPNRYSEYAKNIRDYLNRDKKYTTVKPKPKINTQADIDPFVRKIYSRAKWRVSIIALNALYQKWFNYALDMGIKPEQFNDIFTELDPTLSYSELECELSMRLEANYTP